MRRLLPLLLSSCAMAVAGDAEENCERYRVAQVQWLEACGDTVTHPGTCSDVLSFATSTEVDDCIAKVRATPCGPTTPDPCGGYVLKRPW